MNKQSQIKDIPSISKTQKDAESLANIKKAWPILRPLFKTVGVDIDKMEDPLSKIDELIEKSKELISIPDQFNELFAEHGWIIYGRLDMNIVKEAILLAESGDFGSAERVLVNYHSPELVERELKTMRVVSSFQSRMALAEKALKDYQERRYYACVLVILSLLDGMVNELQQRGFFSKDVDLTAWDSIAAHSKGLQLLSSIFNRGRQKTRTEQITVPFRNGIVHGMDLGYDNKIVAAKVWAALFATREWALKAERGELVAPPPKPEKSWKEILHQLQEIKKTKERLADWKPRQIKVGRDIPPNGNPDEFEEGSPEKKLAEYFKYWMSNNYGFMAKYLSPKLGPPVKEAPKQIREIYQGKTLQNWEIINVEDQAAAITIITTKLEYVYDGQKMNSVVDVRLICEDENDFGVVRGKPGSKWALVNWGLV